ncbi:MAG: hypothetical protein KDA57_02835 [Planctomycetales bacterium]|nr:hypothetical protein [Planctomycetales bacterium]
MKYFRLSLAAMLLLTTLVPITLVALINASNFWASFAFTTALCTLLFAVSSTIYRRDSRRAFWVGFSIFGISYFLITFGPWFDNDRSPEFLSSRLVPYLHSKVRRLLPPDPGQSIIRLKASGQITHNGNVVKAEQIPSILEQTANAQDVLLLIDTNYETSFPESYNPDLFRSAKSALLSAVEGKVSQRDIRSTTPFEIPLKKDFERTFHSLLIVYSGLLGGLIGRYLYLTSK